MMMDFRPEINRISEKILRNIDAGDLWKSYEYSQDEGHYERVVDDNLYSGSVGITYFLSYANKLNVSNIQSKVIFKILDSYIDREGRCAWGFYNGSIGNLFAIYEISQMYKTTRYDSWLNEMLKELLDKPIRSSDIISGASGSILGLLKLHPINPELCSELINKCFSYLISGIEDWAVGMAFRSLPSNAHPLVGYSHGQSGIIHCLNVLNNWVKNEQLQPIIDQLLKFEDFFWIKEEKKFLDLRSFLLIGNENLARSISKSDLIGSRKEIDKIMNTWCHGLPGVLMGRKGVRNFLDYESLGLNDIFPFNSLSSFGGLCHGFFGNLDISIGEGGLLGAKGEVENYYSKLIFEGVDQGVGQDLSLLTGLAGVGFQLLRCTYPDEVQSILSLESEPTKNTSLKDLKNHVSEVLQNTKIKSNHQVQGLRNEDYLNSIFSELDGKRDLDSKKVLLKTANSFTDVQLFVEQKKLMVLEWIEHVGSNWLFSLDICSLRFVRSCNNFEYQSSSGSCLYVFNDFDIQKVALSSLLFSLVTHEDVIGFINEIVSINRDNSDFCIKLMEQIEYLVHVGVLVAE